jgi:hypothetical protein
MRLIAGICAAIFCVGLSLHAQEISAPQPQSGTLAGTVLDVNGGIVSGATIVVDEGTATDQKTATSNDTGDFTLTNVSAAVEHHITVHAGGFKNWISPAITLIPGQALEVTDIKMMLSEVEMSVNAIMPEQLALQQVHAEEKQRVLGVIPNFYVVYDKNPMPLTTKLKFQLALRAGTDPATIGGAAFLAGIYQAAGTPNYQQGLTGYGQRFGATLADGFSDIMIGGAILPSLLHQDPRYFYQGTGSIKSRALHAISAPFICKGDNGKWQFNYSSVGGDLASGALSNLYYPASNRGTALVFSGALITTGARIANTLAQEFVLHRFTSKPKDQN